MRFESRNPALRSESVAVRFPAVLLSALALLAAAPVAHGQASANRAAPSGGLAASPGGASESGVTSEESASETPATPTTTPTEPAPAGPAYAVTTSRRTNFRSRATSGSRRVARLRKGTRVRVTCQRMGAIAPGRFGRSRIWDRVVLPNGRRAWVADGLLNTGSELLVAKICGDPGYSSAESGATSGRCPVGTPVKLLEPFDSAEDLIDAALPGARASQRRYRVPVAMTLAQTILETGGGRIAAGANNYFGIKARATDARGVYAWGENASGCVLKKTREAERDGSLVITIGAFRAYTSLENSILDHGDLLTSNPVYRSAFRYTNDARRFARVIASRYATDPKYALKLLELMKRYKLESR